MHMLFNKYIQIVILQFTYIDLQWDRSYVASSLRVRCHLKYCDLKASKESISPTLLAPTWAYTQPKTHEIWEDSVFDLSK